MVSSHAVKRFFGVFGWWHGSIYRKILNRLFIWRLRLEQPAGRQANLGFWYK